MAHDVLQESPGIVIEFARLEADDGIIKDRRETPSESQAWKKGDQSESWTKLLKRKFIELGYSKTLRP